MTWFAILAKRDVLSGLMFVAWGAIGLWLARGYPTGSLLRMGPGYLPIVLCWILIVLGTAICLRAVWRSAEKMEPWHWRPLLLIPAALLVFAFLIKASGLLAAAFMVVVLSAFGGHDFRLKEVTLLALFLAIAAIALFIYGLGLPLAIWPIRG